MHFSRWPYPAVLAAAIVAVVLTATIAHAQTGRNLLVVVNDTAADAGEIARRYAAARQVPDAHIVHLRTSLAVQISRAEFERDIQAPITTALSRNRLQDRILYVVLTRGMPLRIAGTPGRSGTVASVDSEIALLYRRMTGVTVPAQGPVRNPYFVGDAPLDRARPFRRRDHDVYLVTRLDGFTTGDALALIERAAAPAKEGRVLLDEPQMGADARAKWFAAAVQRLGDRGFGDRVVQESTSRPLLDQTGVLGYYSWGSNDPALAVRHPGLTFGPGALAATYLSTDARTLAEPPADWKPGRSTVPNQFAGSNQSLSGDLIRSGATGVAGQVSEPYLDGAVRPDILFPSYLTGANLAEAFYLAMPYLSWQTVVFGDPLCAPFRESAGAGDDGDDALDPETELPRVFSERRLAVLKRTAAGDDGPLKLLMRAEARLAHDDQAGAIEALTQATARDDRLLIAWRALAGTYERAQKYAAANDAHRRVLAIDPNDVASLNNLSYNIAVHEKRPTEALPLARRAALIAKGNPLIEDTLGWIYHLLGNDLEALRLIESASRLLPAHAEVQLHAAVVLAAAGRLPDAQKALAAAGELDPSLKTRADFQAVQQKLAR